MHHHHHTVLPRLLSRGLWPEDGQGKQKHKKRCSSNDTLNQCAINPSLTTPVSPSPPSIHIKPKTAGRGVHPQVPPPAGQVPRQVHLRALEGPSVKCELCVCMLVFVDVYIHTHTAAHVCCLRLAIDLFGWREQTHTLSLSLARARAQAPKAMQEQWGCVIGRDYPLPIVDHAVASKVMNG